MDEQDVLGADYESIRLTFEDDAEGEVVATLVRRRAPGRKAVLYVHGFVDYFFQAHLADFYVERGYSFYALDLRKYGRSLLPHQTPNFARSMSDYFPEIDEAVRLIREENDVLLLNGHSTGGLIAALWADRVKGQGLVDGLFLNSPFLELNVPAPVRALVGPLVRAAAKVRPTMVFPTGVSESYVRSIHRDHDGEWDFDLAWKPARGFPVRLGWLSAVMRAHRQTHTGLAIDVPVLVMASARTARGKNGDVNGADVVLDVDDIARWSTRLGPHVTCVRVDGGLHDLALSAEPVRKKFFTELDRWMTAYM
ncbi:alpha/beta hydrolase [Actinoallomurus bryophytorum]|uniref:Alpha-beta hydrolase superfamily lysophospholipase n=1 Tax=Actinoallomurus bryophytorum TaxID=1490222 RepID=A0A543CQQ8_9ACTN|nr:alpha/beta hydrolase [Actinoallomurus bryophytorum]TQL99441.1 alpha-beta hydrolase superfamily lysophospholipase [Actinoallomurus bryophytorum]